MPDKIRVGNVDIVAVLDMVPPPREPSMMFPTTSAQDWESHQDALEDGQLQLYYLHFFLRSQGKTIMVDTGMAPGPHPDRCNRTRDLINQLKNKNKIITRYPYSHNLNGISVKLIIYHNLSLLFEPYQFVRQVFSALFLLYSDIPPKRLFWYYEVL